VDSLMTTISLLSVCHSQLINNAASVKINSNKIQTGKRRWVVAPDGIILAFI
jgi:hypothetical protein